MYLYVCMHVYVYMYLCRLEHNYVLSSFLNGYYCKNQIQTKFPKSCILDSILVNK